MILLETTLGGEFNMVLLQKKKKKLVGFLIWLSFVLCIWCGLMSSNQKVLVNSLGVLAIKHSKTSQPEQKT